MKQTIGLAGIFLILLAISPPQNDTIRDDKGGNNTIPDIYYNPAAAPFANIINWKNEEQRKKYDTILNAKYDILDYEIRYMDSSTTEIPNPYYKKEKLRIIYDPVSDYVLGYIWTVETMKLPILVYKLKPGFLEDPLIYSRLNKYELIYEFKLNKRLALASFEALSLDDWKQTTLEMFGHQAKRYRGLVKKNIFRNYLHAPSTIIMLAYAENNLSETTHSLKTQAPNKTIWIYLKRGRMQEYEKIAKMIKQDTEKYGGGKWEKIWKDMQKIWPALRSI